MAPGLDPSLDADTIYERVLANRFDASAQELVLYSGDRAGRELPIRVVMLWRRYGDGSAEARKGILSRTLVRYLEPAEIGGTGYLVVNKRDGPDDQFIYLPSMRRTRRINLRTEGIVGTDLSVEDIIPREMDDALYSRAPDDVVAGRSCYVVEAIPTEASGSGYSRLWIYVEGAHYVPLKTRYWNAVGVEVKELSADPASIREVQGIWLAVRAVMRQLLLETYTRLEVDWITPNPELSKKFFTQRQLETQRVRVPKAVKRAAIRMDGPDGMDGPHPGADKSLEDPGARDLIENSMDAVEPSKTDTVEPSKGGPARDRLREDAARRDRERDEKWQRDRESRLFSLDESGWMVVDKHRRRKGPREGEVWVTYEQMQQMKKAEQEEAHRTD